MKNRLIPIITILVLIFTTIIVGEAIAPTPKIELNDYQLTVDNNSNVVINGNVNICVGQQVGVYDSSCNDLYAYTTLGKSNGQESFKVKIPSIYLKEGENTFKVKSLPIRGIINGSNSKTITIQIKSSKKDQTITASNLTLYVNETKNLNAKASSNLTLTYKSSNSSVATVDPKGNVVGRNAGTTNITINQAGNKDYNAISKTITVTVKNKLVPEVKTYTITYNANGGNGSMSKQSVKEGQNLKLEKNKFTRDGYTFKGWNTSPNSKILYKNEQIIAPNKNITLYAIWEGNPVKVKYKANGGHNKMDKPTIETHVGKTIEVKSGNKLSRDYYTFAGWATSKNGKVKYKPGNKINIIKDKDIVLYAVWKRASLADCAKIVYNTIGKERMWHQYAVTHHSIDKAKDWADKYNIKSSAKNVSQLKGKDYWIMCNRAVSISLQQAGYLDRNDIINHKAYGSAVSYAKEFGGTVNGKYYKGKLNKKCHIYHPNKIFGKLSNKYKPKTGAVYVYESNIAIYDGKNILSCNKETKPYNTKNVIASSKSYCYTHNIKIVIVPEY